MITYEVFEDIFEEDQTKPWKVSFYETGVLSDKELLDISYGFATKEDAEEEAESYIKQLN